jgi:CRP-like cAMP-binding protein
MQADLRRTTCTLPPGHPAMGMVPRADAIPAALQAEGVTLVVPKGAEICAQGEPAQYAYRVITGCARIVKLLADGRRQVTEFVMQGDIFGFGFGAEFDIGAEAVTEVTVRRYKRSSFEMLAARDQEVASWQLKIMSEKLFRAQERLLTLGRRTAAERLAVFLLEMDERAPSAAGGVVALPMTRNDIGDHLGLTVETVSRNFTALERTGAIARLEAGFRIRDRDALDDSVNAMLN